MAKRECSSGIGWPLINNHHTNEINVSCKTACKLTKEKDQLTSADKPMFAAERPRLHRWPLVDLFSCSTVRGWTHEVPHERYKTHCTWCPGWYEQEDHLQRRAHIDSVDCDPRQMGSSVNNNYNNNNNVDKTPWPNERTEYKHNKHKEKSARICVFITWCEWRERKKKRRGHF